MAFKFNALLADGNRTNKQYLFMSCDTGPVGREWIYVTADAVAAVETSGYITDATADGEMAVSRLRPGDRVWVYQVTSIADTRSLEADMVQVVDLGLHMVLTNTGSVVNLSNDLLGASVSYTE